MNAHTSAAALAAVVATGLCGSAHAETITKQGTNASGQTCTVTVERHADGSISAAGAGGGSSVSSSAGGLSSSSSAGGTSVHVQAGGGSVSSSTSTGAGGTSAGVITVNGCTVTTTSP